MKVSAKNAIILISGYNLSTYLTNYEVQENTNPVDVTGFSDGCQNFIPGNLGATIIATAMWDKDANTAFPVLKSYVGTTTDGSITILPEGGTAGNPSLSLPFTLGGITPSGSPNAAISLGSLNFSSYGSNDGVENGMVLHHGSVTVSTTDAGVSDPAATGAITAKCSATLHVWSATTTDSYVVTVEDSPDDITYANLITFTLDGQTVGSERQIVASGNVDQYRRVVATRTGTAGDTFGFTVVFTRDNLITT